MLLLDAAHSMGVEVDSQQGKALARYVALLARASETTNLTGYTDSQTMERMLVLDALAAFPFLQAAPGSRLIDLGSGGGSPGIPLAILRPDCSFVLVDSRDKKVQFLADVAHELGLGHVQALAGRIEDLGRSPQHRSCYDLALAKALAPLPSLVELAAPLLCDGGALMAWKSSSAPTELAQAERAMTLLGMQWVETHEYALPGGDEERSLLRIQRTGALPARFPRRVGVAQKQPL